MATRKTTTNKKDETANETKETAKKTTRRTAAKKDEVATEAKEEVKETAKKTTRRTAAKKDEAATEAKEEVKETAKKTTRKTAAKKDEAATEAKEEVKETAKKTTRKTAAKKDEAATEAKEEVKETAKKTTRKTAAAKKDEEASETKEEPKEINKKAVSLKTSLSEENSESKETNKKVSISSIVNRDKETNTKAIELPENKTETKSSESFLKRDDSVKKEEKKDLKELIKEATAERKNSDRSIVLKTSSPVRKLESIKTESANNKTERESITLLKEAIKAKSKNVSRPVTVKKRIAIVDDEANSTFEEKTNESSSELSSSKPIINSVFAAHNIKDNNDNLLNKTEQPEETETKEIDKPESTVSSAIEHNNYTSSAYSFNRFETKEEIKNNDEVTETSEIKEEKAEEKTEIIEEAEKKSEEITEETAISSDSSDSEEKTAEITETETKSEEIEKISEEKTEEVKETSSNETFERKIDINEKATYSKSDIFKRPVVIPPNDEDVIRSKYNQEEMDHAIKTAQTIGENEEIEKTLNEKLQELKDKDIKIIETEDELKSSSLPEIEKKPAEPYVAPPHSMDGNKKSNKIIAIVGIIIIFGLSFLGIQFFSGKSNEIDDGFYDIVTNETITNNNLQTNIKPQTNTAAVNTQTNAAATQTNAIRPQTNTAAQTNAVKPQTNTVRPQTNTVKPQTNTVRPQTNAVRPQTNTVRPQTNTVKPQTNTAVNTQTNTQRPQTNAAPTPPKEPEITPPTPPTPPPNPPAANTNASANIQNNSSGTTVSYNSDTYKTKWTDTLTSIAINELGDSRRWPSIFVLNEEIINNPDSIVFNKDIKIPKGGKKKVEDMNDTEKRQLYNDYLKVSQIYQKIGKQSLANAIKTQANTIIK